MRITAIIVALVLAGCGLATSYQIAQMSPDQLTKISDNDLCQFGSQNNPAVVAERQKRDLGDCDPGHLYCRKLGLKTGTDAYVNCRLQMAQIGAQQAAAQQCCNGAAGRCNDGASACVPTAADADAHDNDHQLQRLWQYAELHEHAALVRIRVVLGPICCHQAHA